MDLDSELALIKEQADLLKALSNPIRLCIVRELMRKGSCNVNFMQHCLKLSQSTVSQHLGRLREKGIITGERKGTEIYYKVTSKKVAEIIRVLF